MDQESFRKLLQTKPGASAATSATRSTNAPSAHGKKTKTKNADPAQPAFKPRTVKKLDQYRDRAGERRQGLAHDYAQVEALAEDFEKRNADKDRDTLEEQRKYLGGDSEHTVLVKGLDFALLEQNKARLAEESTVADDVLEQAFVEGSSQAPKKRTREDIIRDLKNKRAKGSPEDAAAAAPSADVPLDDVKKTGKFKPIGFKPIGASKKKKAKAGEPEGAPKKKKKKLDEGSSADAHAPASTTDPKAALGQAVALSKPAAPEPEPMDDDDDIFAGAGDYTGIEVGDDDDDEEDDDAPREPKELSDGEAHDGAPPPRRWVDVDEPPVLPPRSTSPERAKSTSAPPHARESASPERDTRAQADEDAEDAAPARLQPLASSAVPSIRELLAIDEAKEREAKRRARREKKKGKKTTAGDDSE